MLIERGGGGGGEFLFCLVEFMFVQEFLKQIFYKRYWHRERWITHNKSSRILYCNLWSVILGLLMFFLRYMLCDCWSYFLLKVQIVPNYLAQDMNSFGLIYWSKQEFFFFFVKISLNGGRLFWKMRSSPIGISLSRPTSGRLAAS